MALYQLRDALPVKYTAIEKGLMKARLPGRFQQIPGTVETVLDVAHNPEGAEVLATQLASIPAAGKTLAIFSVLSDKDVAGMVRPLLQKVDRWFVTGNKVNRGQSAQDIAAKFTDWSPQLYEDASSAWQAARQTAQPGDRILGYGSFYLVSDLLREVEHG